MKVYTITGGIGSGKSIVCKIFEILGVPVYYADNRSKYLVNNDIQLKKEIKELFGKEAYDQNAQYNSKFIASQVFSNSQALQILNELIHPKVKEDFDKWLKANQNKGIVLKEAAILTKESLEAGNLIYVFAPLQLRIYRVLKRDSFRTKEDIQKIIEKQLSDEEFLRLADYTLKNDEESMLLPQIVALHKTLQNT